jgi:hypothetical protein
VPRDAFALRSGAHGAAGSARSTGKTQSSSNGSIG